MDLVKNNDHISISRGFDTTAFGEQLEAAMKANSRKSKWTQKKSFAPSGVGYGNGNCPRYWYYAFHGEKFEYNTDATSIANMDAGTDSGKRLAHVLGQAGMLVASEVEIVSEDPPIRGFIDAVVSWKGEEIIGEIKTTKAEAWNTRANSMKVPGYQLIQLLIYMKLTNKPRGFFLTENKNTHEILIVPVRMTEENEKLVDYVFDWMRETKKNSDEDKLPKRPFTKSSFTCKGCPVKTVCWEGYKRGSVNGTDPNPGVVALPVLELPK